MSVPAPWGADLHLHSRHSDGTEDPRRLLERAASLGLSAISLTDHDSVEGLPEAFEAGKRLGVRVLAGVEFSAEYLGHEIHLLGYGIDAASEALLRALRSTRDERLSRAERIVERLNRLGVPLTMKQVHAGARGASLGRPHLAEALRCAGAVSSSQEAFDRYLNPGRPAFVPRAHFSFDSARQVIREAGGVVVLAHPHLNLSSGNIRSLVDCGIDGLEVSHPRLKPSQCRELSALAEEKGILATGGSDCHGARRGPVRMGSVRVAAETVDQILKQAGRLTDRNDPGRAGTAAGEVRG